MSRSGLHTGAEFGASEREKKRKREEELEELVQRHGRPQDVVYRDQHGRRIDKAAELQQKEEVSIRQKKALEEAQQEIRNGSIQKLEREDARREYEELKLEPFARSINDPKLERMRKDAVRDGDPMAEFIQSKKDKQQVLESGAESLNRSRTGKPLYRGPNPTPNRFSLRPGYRWDAIDRSNGFERKVLLKINEKSAFNEEEYRWRVSDM